MRTGTVEQLFTPARRSHLAERNSAPQIARPLAHCITVVARLHNPMVTVMPSNDTDVVRPDHDNSDCGLCRLTDASPSAGEAQSNVIYPKLYTKAATTPWNAGAGCWPARQRRRLRGVAAVISITNRRFRGPDE
jgi:hypothetical protein